MSARFSFPKQARLLRERDFRRVYREGLRLTAFPLWYQVFKGETAQRTEV